MPTLLQGSFVAAQKSPIVQKISPRGWIQGTNPGEQLLEVTKALQSRKRGLGLGWEHPLGLEHPLGCEEQEREGSWRLNLSREGLDPFSEVSRGRISVPKEPNSPFSSPELGGSSRPQGQDVTAEGVL